MTVLLNTELSVMFGELPGALSYANDRLKTVIRQAYCIDLRHSEAGGAENYSVILFPYLFGPVNDWPTQIELSQQTAHRLQ